MLRIFLLLSLTAMQLTLWAQSANGTQFLIQYNESLGPNLRHNVRNYYQVSDYIDVNDDIELWDNLTFPKIVAMPNNTTQTLSSLTDLLEHVAYTSGNGQTVVGALIHGDDYEYGSGIKEGDLNYDFTIDNISGGSQGGTFDILPSCDARTDERIIHEFEDGEGMLVENQVEVIIMDQLVNQAAYPVTLYDGYGFEAIPSDMLVGGDHGTRILSIIDNQLAQAGAEATYVNAVMFDVNGVCTYDRLLAFFESFERYRETFELINPNTTKKYVMNFSANMLVVPEDQDLILWDKWEQHLNDRNLILVTSVGNQSINGSDLIYPACANWSNEISVAGTKACFRLPWNRTNRHNLHFDIAAEAKDIMAYDGTDFDIVAGTSYSAAMVTGAMAQLMLKCGDYDAITLRNHLISSADEVAALASTVKDGKVLNLKTAYETLEACSEGPIRPGGGGGIPFGGDLLQRSPTGLMIAPNPFSSTSLVTIPVTHGQSASVQLYSKLGQQLLNQDLGQSQGHRQFQWELPASLQPGSYLLRVRVGDEWTQQVVIKQ